MKRASDDADEVNGIDFLAKQVLEEVEFTDTGCVDTEGNKIVLTKSRLSPIGYIVFERG